MAMAASRYARSSTRADAAKADDSAGPGGGRLPDEFKQFMQTCLGSLSRLEESVRTLQVDMRHCKARLAMGETGASPASASELR